MIVCYFDGACAPSNPNGSLGIGSIILRTKNVSPSHNYNTVTSDALLWHSSGIKFGDKGYTQTTNNMAEYMALINILHYLVKNKIDESEDDIVIFGDSQLVIKQMRGEWKIKDGLYSIYARQAKSIWNELKNVRFEWIPRDFNFLADELRNKFFLENRIKTWGK